MLRLCLGVWLPYRVGESCDAREEGGGLLTSQATRFAALLLVFGPKAPLTQPPRHGRLLRVCALLALVRS